MAAYYRVNFEGATNEDLRQGFKLTDTEGAPVSLSGATLRMEVDNLANDDVLEASLANGRIVVTNAAQGEFSVAVPASVMAAVAPGVYRHDLLLTRPDGSIQRIWEGTLTLNRGVTE